MAEYHLEKWRCEDTGIESNDLDELGKVRQAMQNYANAKGETNIQYAIVDSKGDQIE